MHLTDICRLCLIKSSKTTDELFFPIDEAFEKKFQEITNLILHKKEECSSKLEFPATSCITCLSELESFYNYRCGLIEKQKRLNVLLGIKSELSQFKKEVTISDDPKEVEESNVEVDEFQEEQTETTDEEHIESSEIIEDDIQEVEEIICDEEVEPMEELMIYDEEVYKEDTGDEFEIEHEYLQEEDSDDKYYYVKGNVEGDDGYIVFEDQPEPSTSHDVKPKRKYIKSKDTDKQFKCWMEECVAVFSFRATMRKHMLTIHGIECDKSTCLICGQRFNEYSAFLGHVKTHTRKSECDICKLRFVNDEKMLRHKARVHANDFQERCYPCEVSSFLTKL